MPDSLSTNNTVADAVRGHWADRFLPESWKPYARMARLERPIGWWLLLWPCWWSATLASDAAGYAWPNLWHLLLFLVGAVAMRGAGCTYNDIVDRDLDARVARTRSRPIPSGQVTVRQAKIFLVVLALVGFLVLIQFNTFTIGLGILSLATIAGYPFMKRVTNWPQLGLGISFSWGALMGWPACGPCRWRWPGGFRAVHFAPSSRGFWPPRR
jgi:4-hydroxybenzoate polyprenyltransferase